MQLGSHTIQGHLLARMIIQAKNIQKYFHSLRFPVAVLAEAGPVVAMEVERAGLLKLIEEDAVIGIGTWKVIQRLRLTKPLERINPATFA